MYTNTLSLLQGISWPLYSYLAMLKKLFHSVPLQAFICTHTHSGRWINLVCLKLTQSLQRLKSPIHFNYLCIICAWSGQTWAPCWWQHKEQSSHLTPCPMFPSLSLLPFWQCFCSQVSKNWICCHRQFPIISMPEQKYFVSFKLSNHDKSWRAI